jgi:hypothetical protein
MIFIASGDAGRSCKVTVKGYGGDRPLPTAGDKTQLAQLLANRLGGTLIESDRVKANGKRYSIAAFVGGNGDLGIWVYE